MKIPGLAKIVALLAMLGMAGAASATVVSYDFTGHVTNGYGFASMPVANTPLTGSISFDTAAIGSTFYDYAPCCGKIYATGTLSLDVGSTHFSASNVDAQFTSGNAVRGTTYLYEWYGSSLRFFFDQTSGLPSDYRQVVISLYFNTGGSYGALPGAINLASLSSTDVNLDAGVNGFASGTLDTITPSAVPEPASWALMIAGFGAVGGMLRRRRIATIRLA